MVETRVPNRLSNVLLLRYSALVSPLDLLWCTMYYTVPHGLTLSYSKRLILRSFLFHRLSYGSLVKLELNRGDQRGFSWVT